MQKLQETISSIRELDREAMGRALARQGQLTKPAGSLGILEELSVKLAGITGEERPKIGRKVVIVMAGDHGVTAEGVSAFPSEVTPQMVLNFVAGGAAINVLSRHVGADIVVVDVGVAAPIEAEGVAAKKVRSGTANMVEGPAMMREEAVAAIQAGIEVAQREIDNGATLIATGDMGIGNTTASSALLAAFTDHSLDDVVGRGTGVGDDGLANKRRVIAKALEVNKIDPADPLGVLAAVGGLEIAGIAGVIIGAASSGVPVIIDGFISGAGALAAAKIAPASIDYMIASHSSVEPGHRLILEALELRPMLFMDMRLGEGTGAALAMTLVEAASKILDEMATFAEAGVSEKEQLAEELESVR